MSPLFIDVVYVLILIFGLPYAIYKVITSRRFRAGWGERFGGVPDLPKRRRFWVHCASVGEVLLARTLAARLKAEYHDADIVLSTNTNTGRETAQKTFPGHTVFYFPLDLSFVVRKVFARIKPSAVVLVELELWPNFLTAARRRGVPVVVVNGRITEHSVVWHRRLRWCRGRILDAVRHFAVQNDEYAEGLARIGIPRDRITIAGTMKYDSVATDVAPDVVQGYEKLFRLRPDDDVILGGCTHPGEDELLIGYARKRREAGTPARLILAPRHRERADAVARLVREAGSEPIRKTALDTGTALAKFENGPHVVLIDTTGELARLYSLATVVFIGGSLVEHGGHNMIEPAALGKPVVFGPHTRNFRETVDILLSRRAAIQVDGPGTLAAALDKLLADPDCGAKLGANAKKLVEENKGATERNFEAVRPFLDETRRDAECP